MIADHEAEYKGAGSSKGNIFGFGGTSYDQPDKSSGGLKTSGRSGAFVVNPGWQAKDNSSKGSVIKQVEPTRPDTNTDTSVHSQVRDIWAKKFSNSTDKTIKSPDRIEKCQRKSVEMAVNCPICNLKVPEKDINHHIDTCLESPKKDEDTSNAFVEDESSLTEPDQLPCPVCSKPVYKQEINRHLDFCMKS